ncbi:hypothetical protein EPA93_39475 [Ktedonosporobacter rubrisoli]|uniref:Uncharacterized protein n=1 Tax=Ktedonosporobacter rubrisoli TaxID=2509675 RepID=A0A4P6K211_KTERU|nr:hypothetical protein [Ktedonosporobacter rubrisoli]QBD81730.1 hypothetical protein EPA93_39475 [Ktedonosporobacter rubrisoli]
MGQLGTKEPCQVLIEMINGEISSCEIKNKKGHTLLAGKQALDTIAGVGKLNWEFELKPKAPDTSTFPQASPQPETTPMRYPSYLDTSPIPIRTPHMMFADVQQWPRKYRQVFVLIDGQRSSEKIALMLSQPQAVIEGILRELQARGVIFLE